MTQQSPLPASRLQRLLAFTAIGLVLLSLIALFSVIIATGMGAGAHNGFGHGAWPFVLVFPAIALPVGFILIIVLLIVSAVRRSRMNSDSAPPAAPGAAPSTPARQQHARSQAASGKRKRRR